jgi:hypothetical protein
LLIASPNAKENGAHPSYVSDFLALSDGLPLAKAFVTIKDRTMKRLIVDLVTAIADPAK